MAHLLKHAGSLVAALCIATVALGPLITIPPVAVASIALPALA